MFPQIFKPYPVGNPWREMDRLHREMNRLFDHSRRQATDVAPGYPAMNIWTNEDGVAVTAELPGVHPETIDLSVVGDTLTISGSRQVNGLPEGASYHRRERKQGKFSRTFQFPFAVDSEGVEAKFEKGVLHISLPRAETTKPKKIPVVAG